MTGTEPRSPTEPAVLRPRTVVPGGNPEAPVLRPRTIPPLGRPSPIVVPLEQFADQAWDPPSPVVAPPVLELEDHTDRAGLDDIWVTDNPSAEVLIPGAGRHRRAGGDTAEISAVPAADDQAGESRMLRNNVLVATGTMLSRITGLLRTVLLFATLAPVLRDAYVLANNTPNIIYELILGGVLTATLVPLFTEFVTTDDDEATSAVVSASIVALLALTALAFVASPLLMLLYSSNTPDDVSRGDFLTVGVQLSLLFAPQVFFYGAMAVGSALLNSRRRFFAAAWAPVLNNVVVIALLVSVGVIGGRPDLHDVQDQPLLLLLLGLGTTAGIVAMAVALVPALRRAGVPLRFTWSIRHPAVRRAVTLSGWTVGYVIANQVAGQIVNVLTEPGSSGTANYQLAFQFFQLPHGLLAVSLMTTFQPELARAFTRADPRAFAERLLTALRLLGIAVLPAVVLFIAVPLSTIVAGARIAPDATLVEVGSRFLRLGDVAEVSRILASFAAGLLGFSLYLFVLRAFYSRGDTKTPFYLNCFENLLNIVFAVALVGPFGVVGLALGYGLAYTVAAVVSAAVLLRRLEVFDLGALLGTYARLILAGLVTGAVAFAVGWAFHTQTGPTLLVGAAVAALAGLVAYPIALVALRTPGVTEVVDRFRRRRSPA